MSIASALFSDSQSRVFRWLFGQPERHYHLNELLRLTNLGSASLQRELGKLAEAGLVNSEKVGNLRRFQANKDSPVFDELVALTRKTLGAQPLLQEALAHSADDPGAELLFRLHDFGSRGVSSHQSAAIGGLAHLIAFRCTDTVAALVAGRRYYDCPMAGFSIPAAEHSTILAWGQEHELEAYRTMLDRFARPGAVLAVVSDSYDLWHAVDHLWGEALRQQVMDSGATVVIRPDSGDPLTIVPELLRRLPHYQQSCPPCLTYPSGGPTMNDEIAL